MTEQLRQDKNLLLETEELKKKLNEAEQRIKEISELNAKLCKDLEVSKKTIEGKTETFSVSNPYILFRKESRDKQSEA